MSDDKPAVMKPAAMTLLEIPGKTPEEIEQYWFKEVYQGDNMPQLTLRSILMGSVIGVIMCLSNLYVGLKIGWGLGVVVTAAIMSFAIYGSLVKLAPSIFGKQMSILENNAMASTASAAGYSTGGTMVSATAAYLMLSGHHIPWVTMVLWTFFLSALGVFFAIPMKRQMVNIEQLKFPTGTAAAVTLRSLYAQGSEATKKAMSLGGAALAGAFLALYRDLLPQLGFVTKSWFKKFLIPDAYRPSWMVGGVKATWLTMNFDFSLIMIGAGAIMGMRVAASMLAGAIVCYGVLAPWMIHEGVIKVAEGANNYRAIVTWSLWTGVSIMVTSSLLQFAMQGKTVVRALSGLVDIFRPGKKRDSSDPMERIEVPSSWFLIGFVTLSIGTILTAYFGFGIPMHHGLLAIVLSLVLCIVACRATGETDITPIGALGKITQLTYGVLIPKNMTANLMTASITGNTATASADLLTDLKSGYLLGANPRKQFLAQFIGCFVGTAAIVPIFYILVPTAADIGGTKFPAPAAQTWAGVARLLSEGFSHLHTTARWGMVIGAAIGIVLPLMEKLLGKAGKWLPSATALGLAFVIPFYNSLSMFIGAAIAWILEKSKPKFADDYVIPVSSGLIAGESLVGVTIALLMTLHVIGT